MDILIGALIMLCAFIIVVTSSFAIALGVALAEVAIDKVADKLRGEK